MKDGKVKLSVLVSARPDSKYLAKFVFGYLAKTHNFRDTELLIMNSARDKWNEELIWWLSDKGHARFWSEDYKLGRHGLHLYFNDLLQWAQGDWIIYFCEDHYIIKDGWDQKIRQIINDRELDPEKIYTIIPKFDNCGAMNQIVSRGFVNALGGVIGRHGWIDSYINELNERTFGNESERVIRMDEEIFHDFTHDHPTPFEIPKGHKQSPKNADGTVLPSFESTEVREIITADVHKLKQALAEGK